jgi:hypothetical protein
MVLRLFRPRYFIFAVIVEVVARKDFKEPALVIIITITIMTGLITAERERYQKQFGAAFNRSLPFARKVNFSSFDFNDPPY